MSSYIAKEFILSNTEFFYISKTNIQITVSCILYIILNSMTQNHFNFSDNLPIPVSKAKKVSQNFLKQHVKLIDNQNSQSINKKRDSSKASKNSQNKIHYSCQKKRSSQQEKSYYYQTTSFQSGYSENSQASTAKFGDQGSSISYRPESKKRISTQNSFYSNSQAQKQCAMHISVVHKKKQIVDMLNSIWQNFDGNHDGLISPDQAVKVFRAYNNGVKLSEAKIQEIYNNIFYLKGEEKKCWKGYNLTKNDLYLYIENKINKESHCDGHKQQKQKEYQVVINKYIYITKINFPSKNAGNGAQRLTDIIQTGNAEGHQNQHVLKRGSESNFYQASVSGYGQSAFGEIVTNGYQNVLPNNNQGYRARSNNNININYNYNYPNHPPIPPPKPPTMPQVITIKPQPQVMPIILQPKPPQPQTIPIISPGIIPNYGNSTTNIQLQNQAIISQQQNNQINGYQNRENYQYGISNQEGSNFGVHQNHQISNNYAQNCNNTQNYQQGLQVKQVIRQQSRQKIITYQQPINQYQYQGNPQMAHFPPRQY